MSNYSATKCISLQEQVIPVFRWDDDYVCFAQNHHTKLNLYSASSLKQHFIGRHVALLWHIILIPLKQHFIDRHVAPLWHIILIPLKQHFIGRHVAPLWHIILIPLKQHFIGRHVAPLWHIILIPSQPVFAVTIYINDVWLAVNSHFSL